MSKQLTELTAQCKKPSSRTGLKNEINTSNLLHHKGTNPIRFTNALAKLRKLWMYREARKAPTFSPGGMARPPGGHFFEYRGFLSFRHWRLRKKKPRRRRGSSESSSVVKRFWRAAVRLATELLRLNLCHRTRQLHTYIFAITTNAAVVTGHFAEGRDLRCCCIH